MIRKEVTNISNGKKKIVYTMEDNEDSDGSEVEETKVLFMGLNTHASNSDLDVEG